MNRTVDEILNELKNVESRSIDLLSLGPWTKEIDFVDTEEEIKKAFFELCQHLKTKLNNPVYEGVMENSSLPKITPKFYFEDYESVSLCAWWVINDYEIMLMVTEHDAGALQFLRAASSRILV
jgi:hypothetical protein